LRKVADRQTDKQRRKHILRGGGNEFHRVCTTTHNIVKHTGDTCTSERCSGAYNVQCVHYAN